MSIQDLYDAHLTISGHPITWREILGNAFGFASAIGSLVLPAAAELAREHPGLEIGSIDTHPPEALALLRTGRVEVAIVFRYGVVVLVGLDTLAEDEVIRGCAPRVIDPYPMHEEEAVRLAPLDGRDERAELDGTLRIADLSLERLLVVGDALAKSAALAHDERQVAEVLDRIEPWARTLAAASCSAAAA